MKRRPTGDADNADAVMYFVMTCEGIHPGSAVQMISEWSGPPWMTGQLITSEGPDPLRFRLNPMYPGELLPMYEGAIPLMRGDLIDALTSVGVDNLQLFPAVIRDEESGIEHRQYKAVNIVGAISCANVDASTLMDPEDDSEMIDVNFDSLVIDESRTNGALLFRLAESVNAIIVHRTIRDRVQAIRGMTFYAPGDWSG